MAKPRTDTPKRPRKSAAPVEPVAPVADGPAVEENPVKGVPYSPYVGS